MNSTTTVRLTKSSTEMSSQEFLVSKNGSTVTIEGMRCKMSASVGKATYPYLHIVFRIYFDPINKKSTRYREIKAKLRDDWSYGWKELTDDTQIDILNQLGYHFFAAKV